MTKYYQAPKKIIKRKIFECSLMVLQFCIIADNNRKKNAF